jgi:hypothetical protein
MVAGAGTGELLMVSFDVLIEGSRRGEPAVVRGVVCFGHGAVLDVVGDAVRAVAAIATVGLLVGGEILGVESETASGGARGGTGARGGRGLGKAPLRVAFGLLLLVFRVLVPGEGLVEAAE